MRVSDCGPGIKDLPAVLGGRYESPTGIGLGIVGVQRLMDRFRIDAAPGTGTVVEFGRAFPRRLRTSPRDVARSPRNWPGSRRRVRLTKSASRITNCCGHLRNCKSARRS